MPKRFFYVDYENTGPAGLEGLDGLKAKDRLVIFYSNSEGNLKFSMVEKLNACKAEVVFKKVVAGSQNALDFQLASLLGYDIKTCGAKDCAFYIVSKDKGYTPLPAFWKAELGVTVNTVSTVSGKATSATDKVSAAASKAPAPAKKAAPGKTKQELLLETKEYGAAKEALKDMNLPKTELAIITKFLTQYKTKLGLNNALVKRYGNTKGGKVYQTIKPLLADKK